VSLDGCNPQDRTLYIDSTACGRKKSHSTTVQAHESLVMKFDAINVIIEESRNIVQS
jgi:hypothetical protein